MTELPEDDAREQTIPFDPADEDEEIEITGVDPGVPEEDAIEQSIPLAGQDDDYA